MNAQIARAILAAGFLNFAGLQYLPDRPFTAAAALVAASYFAWTSLHGDR